MPKFFLNFGGPGGYYFTSSPERMAALDRACQQEYSGAVRAIGGTVKGVNITVHTYGIHRALTCEIPENSSRELRDRYDLLRYTAERDSTRPYALTSHNCVTSVATVLNVLDPQLTPADMINPWNLDSELHEYNDDHLQGTATARFIDEYQKTKRQEGLSFLRIRTWADESIESVTDIIKQGYGRGKEGSGERTKSTLIKLGWVTEDKNGILIPTLNAPADFREGLDSYNDDFAKVQHLKALYQKEASVFSFNKHHFFDDNPDYETAIGRLEEQQRRNPHGASAKVLSIIGADDVVSPHEQFKQRMRESRPVIPLEKDLAKVFRDEVDDLRSLSL